MMLWKTMAEGVGKHTHTQVTGIQLTVCMHTQIVKITAAS